MKPGLTTSPRWEMSHQIGAKAAGIAPRSGEETVESCRPELRARMPVAFAKHLKPPYTTDLSLGGSQEHENETWSKGLQGPDSRNGIILLFMCLEAGCLKMRDPLRRVAGGEDDSLFRACVAASRASICRRREAGCQSSSRPRYFGKDRSALAIDSQNKG